MPLFKLDLTITISLSNKIYSQSMLHATQNIPIVAYDTYFVAPIDDQSWTKIMKWHCIEKDTEYDLNQ
jgi:hypothetical protein